VTWPLQMTTTVAFPGEKRPATRAYNWHYEAATFPPGQHKPWELAGDLADVYMRDNGMFGGDLDLYKPEKAEAWEKSALRPHLIEAHGYDDSRPYMKRGDEGSMRLLFVMTPEQAGQWWPAASAVDWGDIRSKGLQPSPGAVHRGKDGTPDGIYEAVPGPDPVQYPADGTILSTNVIRFCEGCRPALEGDGAHEPAAGGATRKAVDLPDDDDRCPVVGDWLAGRPLAGVSVDHGFVRPAGLPA
jgi:hypothetical protein